MSKIFDNGVMRDPTSEELEDIHAHIGGGRTSIS